MSASTDHLGKPRPVTPARQPAGSAPGVSRSNETVSAWVVVMIATDARAGRINARALFKMRLLWFSMLDLVQGRLQTSGQLPCIIVCPEMHEEQPRLFGKHVTVQRRHLDSAFAQRLEHGVDLLRDEHEVPGDRRLAAPGGLEVDDDARTHADGNRHSIFHY